MKRSTQDLVREFHEVFGAPILNTPTYPSYDRLKLRRDLVSEEFWELMRAYLDDDPMSSHVDAIADLVYVSYGMALEMGVDLDAVIREVHAANMRKLDEDGRPIYREDGKVIKPIGWVGPDIEGELARQGYERID